MATATKRTIRHLEQAGDSATDALFEQLASLRKELDAVSNALHNHGSNALDDVRHGAAELVRDLSHQSTALARQATRQANAAGKAVQENPLPAIVAVSTLALLASLFLARD